MREVTLKPIFHRGVHCVKISLGADAALHDCVRRVAGCKWSKTHGGWYVERRENLLRELLACFKGKAFINYTALKTAAPVRQAEAPAVIRLLAAPVKVRSRKAAA